MLLPKSSKAERHIEFTSLTSQKDSLHSWQQSKEKPTILAYPELQNKTKFSKEWSLWYEGLNHREADWIQAPHTSSAYANFSPVFIPPFLLNALEISFVLCLCWPPPPEEHLICFTRNLAQQSNSWIASKIISELHWIGLHIKKKKN